MVNPLSSSRLEELYLSYNELPSIPNDLFQQLQHFKHLWLENKKIASLLPSTLNMISKLEELDLESNFFTSPIPLGMYPRVNLCTLQLHDSILTGIFLLSFSQMTKLTILDLDTNYISGELPAEIELFGQLSELRWVNQYDIALFLGDCWHFFSSLQQTLIIPSHNLPTSLCDSKKAAQLPWRQLSRLTGLTGIRVS